MTTGYFIKHADGSIDGPHRRKALYKLAAEQGLKLNFTK